MMNIYPENSLIMAPLAGYTDVPYRKSLRRHGCKYAFTEMVDSGSLVFGQGRTRNFLDRYEGEEWLGTQLVCGKLDEVAEAVEIINQGEYSVLDLNVGCPTPKVVRKGKGAGLARDPELAAKILSVMAKKSRFPVTAKIRIQDIENPEPTIYLAKKLEDAGAQVITIHGRLVKAIYSGPCYADIIKAVKESIKVPVIANGGVMSVEDYYFIKEQTKCSRVMVARGAMGNPWLFEEIGTGCKRYISTEELVEEIYTHIYQLVDYYQDDITSMKLSRKIILDYLQGRGYPRALKCDVAKIITVEDFKDFMKEVEKGPSQRYLNSLG